MDKEKLEQRNVSIEGELEIANIQNMYFFSGQMTDVNVWDRSLSTDELQDFGLNCSKHLYREMFNRSNCDCSNTVFFQPYPKIKCFVLDNFLKKIILVMKYLVFRLG